MKSKSLRTIIVTMMLMVSLVLAINLGAVFAEGDFALVESYPKDGATNAAVENLGAKLTFSSPVDSAENQAANANCFKIINPEEKELPIKVLYNPKDEAEVLVVYDVNAGGQMVSRRPETYKIFISGDFMNNEGETLGEDITLTFTTINQSRNNRIYFVSLFLMIAVMSVMSMRQAGKKAAEAQAAATPTKDEPFNPYKEAKRTGKSVEEVIAAHEKEVAKMEAKAAKKGTAPKEYVFDDDDDWDTGTYKVKGPRPASAAGSKFVADRKAASKEKGKKN